MAIGYLLKDKLLSAAEETRHKGMNLRTEIVVGFVQDLMGRTPVRTGRLRDSWGIGYGTASLRSERRPDDPIKEIRAKLKHQRRINLPITIQNRAYYARAVELGVPGRFGGRFMLAKAKRNLGNIISAAKARVGL